MPKAGAAAGAITASVRFAIAPSACTASIATTGTRTAVMPVAVRRRSRARATAQMQAGGMAGAHAVRRPHQDAGDALRREIGLGQGDADVEDLAIVAGAVSGKFEPARTEQHNSNIQSQ